jgi:hypothetical protein
MAYVRCSFTTFFIGPSCVFIVIGAVCWDIGVYHKDTFNFQQYFRLTATVCLNGDFSPESTASCSSSRDKLAHVSIHKVHVVPLNNTNNPTGDTSGTGTAFNPRCFSGNYDAQSFVICVVFYRLLFVLFPFSLRPLYCLSFVLRLLNTPWYLIKTF